MYYILSLIRYFINAACKTIMLLYYIYSHCIMPYNTTYMPLLLYIQITVNLSLMMLYCVCTYRFKHIRIELVIIAVENWSNVMRSKRNSCYNHHHCHINTLCTNNFLFENTFEYNNSRLLNRIFSEFLRWIIALCLQYVLWRLYVHFTYFCFISFWIE